MLLYVKLYSSQVNMMPKAINFYKYIVYVYRSAAFNLENYTYIYFIFEIQIHKLKEQEHNKEMWTVKGDNPDYPKRIQELSKEKGRDSEDLKDVSQVPEPDPKRTKLDSDVKSDTASVESFTSDCDVPCSVQTHSEQRLTMDGKPQPPFQWEKWLPSESCPQCKKQYLDPKPSQLRLYLHALSYKVGN